MFCLQGEIHMSDDAIHDILEQTESDPAFQALYDLFDNSNRSLCRFCLVLQWVCVVTQCCTLCDSR